MAVPRYIEIVQALREQIAHAQPGDPLPSDSELVARFGVSRMTARQAVQALAVEGLLYRRTGRGTFVAGHAFHRRLGALRSFSEDMRLRGAASSSRVLEVGVARATAAQATALQVSRGSNVVRVHRVRLADDVPVSIERVALPSSCAAVLDADLVTGSLHEALVALGRVPSASRGSLTARLATADEARLLELPARAALLVEQRLITDAAGVPLESTESAYAGERYVFDVELHRVGDEAGRRRRLGLDHPVRELAGVAVLQDQLHAAVGHRLLLDHDVPVVEPLRPARCARRPRRARPRARPAPTGASAPSGSRRPSRRSRRSRRRTSRAARGPPPSPMNMSVNMST